MKNNGIEKDQRVLEETFGNQYWRMTNLYKIADKEMRTITFRHNRAQKDFESKRTGRDIILKARQLGFSTYCLIYYLDQVIWTENCWVAVIAHERDALEKLFAKILFAWDRLDPDLKVLLPACSYETKNELSFRETNSKIYVDLEVRGGTNRFVHFSEYARIDEKKILATLPTVPTNGEIVIETTPNGIGNRFHNEYIAATRGRNQFKAHFYPWWWDDHDYRLQIKTVTQNNLTEEERNLIANHSLTFEQIEWRRTTIEANQQTDGSNLFSQEFAEDDISCFLTSGSSAFDITTLEAIRGWLAKNSPAYLQGLLAEKKGRVQFVEDRIGILKVFEAPQAGMEYVVGADSSEGGAKGDWSCAQVLRRDNLKQVAVYRQKVDTAVFAHDLATLGKFYKMAHICPERNASGVAVLNELVNIYPNNNIYREKDIVAVMQKVGRKYGYHTNRQTKRALIAGIQNYLRDDIGDIVDIETVEEMMSYQKDGSGFNAQPGKHDDRIIAFGLALEMNETLPVFKPRMKMVLGTWERLLDRAHKHPAQTTSWMSY